MNTMTIDIPATVSLMTPDEVAAELQVATATLAAWRATGRIEGLAWLRIGRAVRYRRADVAAFVAANLHHTGSRS